MTDANVVVVGGGIAGLTVAFDLARAGRRVLVLESADRPGGSVRRAEIAGVTVDIGAESYATGPGTVDRLIDDLGLSAAVVRPRSTPAWVQHAAGAAPLPGGGWLGVPSASWATDVRRAIGWLGSARATLDYLLPRKHGRAARTLGDLVRIRLGSRVLNRLVEPVVGGVYSTPPTAFGLARLPATSRELLQRSRSLMRGGRLIRSGSGAAGSHVAGLRGGIHTLVDALVTAIRAAGGRLQTGTPVDGLEQTDIGWVVRAGSAEWPADAVVLACSAAGTQRLLGTAGSPDGGDVLLCTLVLDCPALDAAPRGSGVLVAAGTPGIAAKALTHATAKWQWLAEQAGPGRHVLRLSYGRIGDGILPDHRAFPQLAINDASRLLGVELRSDQLAGWALTSWNVPGPVAAAPVVPSERVRVTGGWVAGIGLAAVIGHARQQAAALLEGAPPSGRMNE